RATKAVSQALASPLLNDNDITGANYILLNITSGEEEVSMDEIDEITEYIQAEAGNTADIIWGNGVDESLGNKISVTIIATGFGQKEPTGFGTEKKAEKIVRDLDDQVPTSITQSPDQMEKEEKEKPKEPTVRKDRQETFEFTIRKSEDSKEQSKSSSEKEVKRYTLDDEMDEDNNPEETQSDEVINKKAKNETPHLKAKASSEENHESQMEDQQKRSMGRIERLKALALKMRTPNGVNDLEKEPAYKRRNIQLDDTPHSSESNVSRYSLGEDEDNKTSLKQNNSFLHDNVD
ncbi:MAG: hypothetical protein WD530_07755, partial [Vicingaceae bacterium]